ncbi:hypothetical protein ABEB36_001185 [Hypothenemus hampei]|uniref:Kinetochore protein NDC80 n=1 Tax=Hypothenemus hampei TaxID=57062 RepID=A0ABD1FFL7_HYPHA
MRRSNSASQIPLPSTSYNKKNMEYSNSGARNSGARPKSSLLSVASTSKGSVSKVLFTPISRPSSALKRRNSCSGGSINFRISRAKSPLAKKLMNTNDKQWVHTQYTKVRDFVKYSGLFDPDLAEKLKPPTIAGFVELFSTLLSTIVKTVPIQIQNYAEVGMNTLKSLKYPGQLSMSTFKSINTMHGWPQFITIISWLIDRVNISNIYVDNCEQYSEETKNFLYFAELISNYTSDVVKRGNNDVTEEESVKATDALYNGLLNIVGVDPVEVQKSNEIIEVEQAKLSEATASFKKIKEENEEIRNEMARQQDIINDFEKNSDVKLEQIQDELSKYEQNIYAQEDLEHELSLSVKQLQKLLSKQTYKVKDKNILLDKIARKTQVLERKQRKLDDFLSIKDDLELRKSSTIKKIEDFIHHWNVSIHKTYLPELQNLQIKETLFGQPTILIEKIFEVSSSAEVIIHRLLDEYQYSQVEWKNLKKSKLHLEKDIKMDSAQQKFRSLQKDVKLLQEENAKYQNELEVCIKKNEDNRKKILSSHEAKIQEEKKTIQGLNEEKVTLKKGIDENAKEYALELIKAYNLTGDFLKTVEENVNSKFKEALSVLKQYNQMRERKLHSVKELRAINEKVFQCYQNFKP